MSFTETHSIIFETMFWMQTIGFRTVLPCREQRNGRTISEVFSGDRSSMTVRSSFFHSRAFGSDSHSLESQSFRRFQLGQTLMHPLQPRLFWIAIRHRTEQ